MLGGDLFAEYDEQRAMLDILTKTDVDLAWPTASAQVYLRQKWDWNQGTKSHIVGYLRLLPSAFTPFRVY